MRKLWTIVAVMVAVSIIGLNFASAEDSPKKKGGRKHPPIRQIFKKLDADSNGTLCAGELAKSPRINCPKKAAEILKKWDANEDGKVCGKEFAKALKKIHANHKKGGEHKEGDHDKKERPKKEAAEKKCPKEAAKKGCPSEKK